MTRPIERHGGVPAVQHLSDDELLRLLLGEDADALLSRHSLPDLFALHARPPAVQEHRVSYGACRTLAVAKELLARALRQQGTAVEVALFDRLSHASLIGAIARPLRSWGPVLDTVSAFMLSPTARG